MKKGISILLIIAFIIANAFSFIGCRPVNAEAAEVRACWVSSVGNLDFPSKMGLSAEALRKEMDAIVSNCKSIGLNTIFFQVRPMGDALYPSAYFPWSVYLSGEQGVGPEEGFDPLAYFIQKAHAEDLALHAWINPYRIGTGSNVKEHLSADNPAVLHPEYTVSCDSGLYYNPGHPEARKLILNGVAELVRNYDVDGIHFDDYFYPYEMAGFDDSAAYAQYGQGLSLEDFRRHSVNQLIEATYKLIKTMDQKKQFGISPFGIWANRSVDPSGSATNGLSAYADIFSDSKKWVEEGWLDYVCPQIYWSFENEDAPYDVLVDWWDQLCAKNHVRLYIGVALYKVGTDEAGWSSGAVIGKQLRYAAAKKSYAGHSFFRYGLLQENVAGALDSIRAYYNGESEPEPQEIPAASHQIKVDYISLQNATELKITSPENGAAFNASHISVSGTALPGNEVAVNGVAAQVSAKGLFAAYIPLSKGKNTITVSSGSGRKSITVYRSDEKTETLPEFDSFYPAGAVHRNSGDLLTFEVDGPAGVEITLKNAMLSVSMYPSEEDPGHYIGQWEVPPFPAGDKLVLTDFSLEYVSGGVSAKTDLDLTLNLYAGGYRESLFLQKDSYIFDASRGGSQMDHDPLRKGLAVTVLGREGSRALLDNGYWVEAENLGPEKVTVDDAANYAYEMVTVSAKSPFGYSSYCDGSDLCISLAAGRGVAFEWDADSKDMQIQLQQTADQSLLSIVSRSGKRIAGYEILPQKNRIIIFLRYHTTGLSGKTVMLDAGHGGEDPGASGPGGSAYPRESEINLILTAALKEELEKAGAEVLLTRASDKTVSLDQRVEKAVSLAPDLFISLHHNSADQTADFCSTSGGLMLYSSPLSAGLAETLAEQLWSGVGEKEVACRRQSLRVCRQTRFPAVMVEAGYLCNPAEYELLCREDIARKIAKNIVNGLNGYFVTDCS